MNLLKNLGYRTLDAIYLGAGVKRCISGEMVRFPARWSRYYQTDYEPETFRFFRENLKKGDTVLDIGGHIGLFAVVAARMVGRDGKVYTFEPTPFTRGVLEQVVLLNHCDDIVEVRGEAVSATNGTATFFDTGDVISNANSLVRTERSNSGVEVPLVTVDTLATRQGISVDCMKIDVEGAELDVLRGAHETLAGARPAIRLSLHPPFIAQNGQTLQEIWDLLDESRFDVFDRDGLVKKERFSAETDLFDVSVLPR